jgi:nucleoside 2-deoxyribosyltransferase
MIVTFCGSVSDYTEMENWAVYLRSRDVVVNTPTPGSDNGQYEQLTDQAKRTQRICFLQQHTKLIDQADAVFIFNIHQRIGVSATMEVGYALAKGKRLYALQKDTDIGRDIVFERYCSSKEELFEVLLDQERMK